MKESTSLYNSASSHLHFCHSSFAHLCTHISFSKTIFPRRYIGFGCPFIISQDIAPFASLIWRTVENSSLILTHRYLVLVVFARQHLYTSRFEFSHLFHCGGMQEEFYITVQSSITTPTYILERQMYFNTQYITYVSKLAVLINCLSNSSIPANTVSFICQYVKCTNL